MIHGSMYIYRSQLIEKYGIRFSTSLSFYIEIRICTNYSLYMYGPVDK